MHTIDTDIQSSLHTRREYSFLGGCAARSRHEYRCDVLRGVKSKHRYSRRPKARREPNGGYCKSQTRYIATCIVLYCGDIATGWASIHLFLSRDVI